MRLIDADAIERHPRYDAEGFEVGEIINGEDIDNAPTVESRPKGKWIPKGRWHIDPQCIEYTCSVCGRRVMREERLGVIEQYPFCHCGADMREDKI